MNCYTQLNLTKLDVLDGLKEIKVATAYTVNGQDLETFPADLDIMESSQMEIVYKTFEGWQTNHRMSEVRRATGESGGSM